MTYIILQQIEYQKKTMDLWTNLSPILGLNSNATPDEFSYGSDAFVSAPPLPLSKPPSNGYEYTSFGPTDDDDLVGV